MKQHEVNDYLIVCDELDEQANNALYSATVCSSHNGYPTAEEYKHRIIRKYLLDARAKIIRLLSHEERSNPEITPDCYEASYADTSYDFMESWFTQFDRKHGVLHRKASM